MVHLQLPLHEAQLLVRLLERAEREFATHGCNDFNLQEELGLTQGQATGLAPQLREGMDKAGLLDEYENPMSQSLYFTDTSLYVYLRVKVQEALSLKGGA